MNLALPVTRLLMSNSNLILHWSESFFVDQSHIFDLVQHNPTHGNSRWPSRCHFSQPLITNPISCCGSTNQRSHEMGVCRCVDVIWVKTNKHSNAGPGSDPPTTFLFTHMKQHCLIGTWGTVRQSTDSWFVHCNVDTDVIIWEADPTNPTWKPSEMYTLIENFCLGIRCLKVFGRISLLRQGWVTVLSQGQYDMLRCLFAQLAFVSCAILRLCFLRYTTSWRE